MKNILNRILFVAIVYVLTFYVAHFSTTQSIVLTVLLALMIPSISETIEQPKPYEVYIEPNLPKMLCDLGLVPPEWEEPTRRECFPWTPLHILWYGIRAFVLRSDQGMNLLIHWTGPNTYTHELEYRQSIDFVKVPRTAEDFWFGSMDWSPRFFSRAGKCRTARREMNRK